MWLPRHDDLGLVDWRRVEQIPDEGLDVGGAPQRATLELVLGLLQLQVGLVGQDLLQGLDVGLHAAGEVLQADL